MKLREIMTNPVVRIHPEETVAVAARMLEHNNIGVLPVCGSDGRLCGMLTDRDIVIRCVAAGKPVQSTSVREIMTSKVYVGRPDMDVSLAAGLMGSSGSGWSRYCWDSLGSPSAGDLTPFWV